MYLSYDCDIHVYLIPPHHSWNTKKINQGKKLHNTVLFGGYNIVETFVNESHNLVI
jgi:hypothetical protein